MKKNFIEFIKQKKRISQKKQNKRKDLKPPVELYGLVSFKTWSWGTTRGGEIAYLIKIPYNFLFSSSEFSRIRNYFAKDIDNLAIVAPIFGTIFSILDIYDDDEKYFFLKKGEILEALTPFPWDEFEDNKIIQLEKRVKPLLIRSLESQKDSNKLITSDVKAKMIDYHHKYMS
jgi:hypothetical protein